MAHSTTVIVEPSLYSRTGSMCHATLLHVDLMSPFFNWPLHWMLQNFGSMSWTVRKDEEHWIITVPADVDGHLPEALCLS